MAVKKKLIPQKIVEKGRDSLLLIYQRYILGKKRCQFLKQKLKRRWIIYISALVLSSTFL